MRRVSTEIKTISLTPAFVEAIRQDILSCSFASPKASVQDSEIGLIEFFMSKDDKDVTIATNSHPKMSPKQFLDTYKTIFANRK